MATAPRVWAVLLRAMRPHQWIKNVFVVVPLVFAGPELAKRGQLDAAHGLRALLAACGFCLASSATYLLNDLQDVAADRAHPVKKLRPIAAGLLPEPLAWRAFGVLLVAALGLGAAVDLSVAGIFGAYLAMNLAYSRGLKRIAYVDAVVIASGFLLRTLAGGEAAGVHLSRWLITCTVLLALFLALGKRKHELLTSDAGHRAALEHYRVEHLNFALGCAAAAAAGSFALYARDPATVARFGTDALIYTLPFVIACLFRFYQLLDDVSTAQSPTERMLRDRFFVVAIGGGAAAIGAVIYGGLP